MNFSIWWLKKGDSSVYFGWKIWVDRGVALALERFYIACENFAVGWKFSEIWKSRGIRTEFLRVNNRPGLRLDVVVNGWKRGVELVERERESSIPRRTFCQVSYDYMPCSALLSLESKNMYRTSTIVSLSLVLAFPFYFSSNIFYSTHREWPRCWYDVSIEEGTSEQRRRVGVVANDPHSYDSTLCRIRGALEVYKSKLARTNNHHHHYYYQTRLKWVRCIGWQ